MATNNDENKKDLSVKKENADELEHFIEKKKIQNKALKKIIEKIKESDNKR